MSFDKDPDLDELISELRMTYKNDLVFESKGTSDNYLVRKRKAPKGSAIEISEDAYFNRKVTRDDIITICDKLIAQKSKSKG